MSRKSRRGKQLAVEVAPPETWIRRNAATGLGGLLLVYLFVSAAFQSWAPWDYRRESVRTFDGDSANLSKTKIVATLDTPIGSGMNAIWCATYTSGWKQLQQKVTKSPVTIAGAADFCARLNSAPDPAGVLPAGSLYANMGTVEMGIIKTIHEDMKLRFPTRSTPRFGNIPGRSFVFYSCLEARASFAYLYRNWSKPLEFTCGDGGKIPIRSFGFGAKDRGLRQLIEQPRVLMAAWDESAPRTNERTRLKTFAVDLCRNSRPYQVVAARTPFKETLAATLASVEQSIKAFDEAGGQGAPAVDTLQIPEMFWRVSHRFRDIEDRPIENPELSGQNVAVALQDIQFRMERSGAEARSETPAKTVGGNAVADGNYVFDSPFLLYVKRRGSVAPFLVMWIDNVELLQRWGGIGAA